MKILAFLQNQWFIEPEKVQQVFDRHPDQRNRLIRLYLFAGCKTGRRLQQTLGADLCNKIIWEETSKNIGGHSASSFPADLQHMQEAIRLFEPDIVIAFGAVAQAAMLKIRVPRELLKAPHPTARGKETIIKLFELSKTLQERNGILRT